MKYIVLWSLLLFQCAYSQTPVNFFQGASTPTFAAVHQQSIADKNLEMYQSEGTYEKKSVPMGVLYSLLLPGMGELYGGNYGMGKYFTIAEGALWISYAGFESYGTWTQNDARTFAVQHAGINLDNKSDGYFIDIGNFVSVEEYNQEILRERQIFKVYDPSSSNAWHWDSDANRETYRQLRVSSDEKFNNARFVLATIVANHIISAINAGRSVISHNNNSEAELLNIKANLLGDVQHPNGMMLTFTKNF
jgi:hypothetical protein